MIARRRVLVDANIVLDLLTKNAEWGLRSARALESEAETAELVINPVVYAELAGSFASAEDMERYVSGSVFRREDLPWDAAYYAGRAYIQYRRNGGSRRSPMPDFYIGAHAAVRGYALLTRDTAHYTTYFPAVRLIAP